MTVFCKGRKFPSMSINFQLRLIVIYGLLKSEDISLSSVLITRSIHLIQMETKIKAV